MKKQEFLETYLTDRRGTDCSKWDGLEAKFGEKDLLAMWVADMEFTTGLRRASTGRRSASIVI